MVLTGHFKSENDKLCEVTSFQNKFSTDQMASCAIRTQAFYLFDCMSCLLKDERIGIGQI